MHLYTHIHTGTHTCAHSYTRRQEADSPEEESQGTHVAQVHAEHTVDLLQGASPLWLIPARCLQEAVAVGEPQVGIRARGGAGRAGGVRTLHLSAMPAQGWGAGHATFTPSLNTWHTTEHALPEAAPQMLGNEQVRELGPLLFGPSDSLV